MSMLTLEQVQAVAESIVQRGPVGYLNQLLFHDAAQRQRIAELEAEVARLTAERDHLADLHNELRNR